jgi:acid phosphatase (class A)
MRIRNLLIVFLLCVVAVPQASWGEDAKRDYPQVEFLSPELLPPPPEEGSAEWKAQIKAVIRAQKLLPPAEIAAIRDEQNFRVEHLTSVLDSSFNREHLPKTFALLDRVGATTHYVVEADKKFWGTRRPYLADPHVKLYVDPLDKSPAYPSGHTTGARVLAEVLGMIVPEKLPVLRLRAETIARHRVEAGVHYPVDLEGGRLLAMSIVGALLADADFRGDVNAAREEIRSR